MITAMALIQLVASVKARLHNLFGRAKATARWKTPKFCTKHTRPGSHVRFALFSRETEILRLLRQESALPLVDLSLQPRVKQKKWFILKLV